MHKACRKIGVPTKKTGENGSIDARALREGGGGGIRRKLMEKMLKSLNAWMVAGGR